MSFYKIVVGIIFIVLIFSIFTAAQAEEFEISNDLVLNSENLLLLEVKLDSLELKDEYLTSYRSEEEVLIPVGQFASFLELPLKVTPEKGLIEGFIWQESENYRLDFAEGVVQSNDREFKIDDSHKVLIDWDDIYINADLLSDWLPINIEINPFQAILTVRSERPLPIQVMMERRYRWDNLSDKDIQNGSTYPFVENHYSIFNGPFVDHRLYVFGNTTPRHYTRMSGDILYMSGRLNISGPLDDPLDDVSGKLGRRSPDADLLGPLKAHEFWLGDLTQPGIKDISSWESVEGISISSYPYNRSRNFYSHTLEGDLPRDWEVELYDNGTLIDYQSSDQEERYIFDNVPLNYGINEFTLVFYDEYGQKYEEIKRVRVDSSLIPPGENRYQIDIGRDEDNEDRISLEYSRGLNESLSVIGNYIELPGNDSSEKYGRIGLRGSINNLFWEGNYLKEIDGGQGGELVLQTNLADTNINLAHAEFDDYSSERISDLKRRTSIDLRRSFEFPVISKLGTRLEIAREEYTDNEVTTDIYNRLSTSYKDLSFINRINLKLEDEDTTGNGDFSVRTYLGDYRFRGELAYDLNSFNINTISSEIWGYLDEAHTFNLGISRDLNKDENIYTAGITQDVDYYSLGWNASYRDDGDFKIGFSFSTSFGRDDLEDDPYHWVLGPSFNEGAVSITTYIDNGENRVPLEGIAYKVNGRTQELRSNEDGKAFIYGLKADYRTNIAIDLESLDNPFLLPDPEGVSFIPRAGQSFALELPVVMTGEIGGYLYLSRGEMTSGLRNVEVQLLGENDEVIRSTVTAYDGYFYMTELKPGDYKLRISPEAVERRGLISPAEKEINIPKTGGYVDGFKIILERKQD